MVVVVFISCLTGCRNADLEEERNQLQREIETLQAEVDALQTDIEELQKKRDELISKDDIIYIVEIEISQVHYNLKEMAKDMLNKIIVPIQVSEEYYYSVEVDEILNDELRIGSLAVRGSLGWWNVKITDKQIVKVTE